MTAEGFDKQASHQMLTRSRPTELPSRLVERQITARWTRSTFRLRDGCSASTWTAPDGSSLLTLDAPSVQTAPEGSRRIQTDRLDDHRDDQGASDKDSDAAPIDASPTAHSPSGRVPVLAVSVQDRPWGATSVES